MSYTTLITMNKEILKLAIPNILSNITIPLLGLVDTYIAGHLSKTEYIGAISICSTLFMVIYMAFSFLRMGTSGFTAQAYGAKNKQAQADIFLRAITVGLVAGLILIVAQYLLSSIGFGLMRAGGLIKEYSLLYFHIYIWAAPAILMQYCFNGWFVGMQNSVYPMITSIVVNILNIFFAFLFVYHFHLEIKGIALATTISQYCGLALSFLLWQYKYADFKKIFQWDILLRLNGYKQFFKVNLDIFLRTMLLATVVFFFTSMSNKQGDLILGANAILMQFFLLFSYIMDGFAYAAEALTGKYIGAKNKNGLQKLILYLFAWGGGVAVLFSLIYISSSGNIIHLLTDKGELIPTLMEYRTWIYLIPLAGCAAFLWDGIFIGATASKQMRNSMVYSVMIFFGVFFLLYTLYPSNNSLWLSFILFLFARGAIQSIMYKHVNINRTY